MKADITFLRTLRKELHFLSDEEKNNFISEYRTKIDERQQKGEDLKRIIGSFEPPKTIAEKVYAKQIYNEDRYNIKNVAAINVPEAKVFTGTITLIPQFLLFIISLIFLLGGAVIALSSIVAAVFSWLTFDPLQAIGISLLAIGLLPLIGILLFWIGKKLLKIETTIFKSLLIPQAIKNKLKAPMKKGKKIAIIACMSTFSLLTLGGAVGFFAGDKTIGGAMISGNLLHKQVETLNLSEFTEVTNEPIKISYDSLKPLSWYSFTFIKDWTMEESSNLEITRASNTKEHLKMTFTVEKENDNNDNLKLKVDMPWNLLVFNISSNKFTIRYNPEKIDLGV